MPSAIINQPHARVQLTGERLEVHVRDEEGEYHRQRQIPLRDLDRLIIGDTVHLTSAALAALLKAALPIQVFSWQGKFLGGFLPAQNQHGLSRLRQYQRTLEPEFARRIAGRLITAKLYNQRRALQRLAASRGWLRTGERGDLPAPEDAPAAAETETARAVRADLAWLDGRFRDLETATTIDELRGYEGATTARYFTAWARCLPADFPFERRSTRPPRNPVNACISFGATLLYGEATAFCHAHGLDPALGTLHATTNGRWSLALDLIEPFRPLLVEALALDLFSHQILGAGHFETRDGGVFLNEPGRRKFFLQYERRMERQFLSEAVGHRTTLRQQLEQQAVMYKTALERPDAFEPLLMN